MTFVDGVKSELIDCLCRLVILKIGAGDGDPCMASNKVLST